MPFPRLPTVGLAWRASQPSIAALTKHFGDKNTKYLGQKHRRQKTFSQKRTIYLCKKEHICQNQRYKVLLPTSLNTKYLCKKNNRQNLFAEEVPTFFTKNANSVKASSVRHCGCYLGKTCHVHSKKNFLVFLKRVIKKDNCPKNLLQSNFHWCCCFHQSSLFPGVKGQTIQMSVCCLLLSI